MISFINEIITAISLVVVFITVLFSYYVAKADYFINYDLNLIKTSHEELKKFFEPLKSFTIFNWFATIVVLNLIIIWILMPSVIKILNYYDFYFFKFEVVPTIFIAINIYFSIMVLLSILNSTHKCNF
jgi:hypothetical protein